MSGKNTGSNNSYCLICPVASRIYFAILGVKHHVCKMKYWRNGVMVGHVSQTLMILVLQRFVDRRIRIACNSPSEF